MAEHKHAAVLRALADGKVVQYKHTPDGWWFDCIGVRNPISDPQLEWRIKPERKADVVYFHNYYAGGAGIGSARKSLESAKSIRDTDCIGTLRVVITHDDNGSPMRGPVEWCDE